MMSVFVWILPMKLPTLLVSLSPTTTNFIVCKPPKLLFKRFLQIQTILLDSLDQANQEIDGHTTTNRNSTRPTPFTHLPIPPLSTRENRVQSYSLLVSYLNLYPLTPKRIQNRREKSDQALHQNNKTTNTPYYRINLDLYSPLPPRLRFLSNSKSNMGQQVSTIQAGEGTKKARARRRRRNGNNNQAQEYSPCKLTPT